MTDRLGAAALAALSNSGLRQYQTQLHEERKALLQAQKRLRERVSENRWATARIAPGFTLDAVVFGLSVAATTVTPIAAITLAWSGVRFGQAAHRFHSAARAMHDSADDFARLRRQFEELTRDIGILRIEIQARIKDGRWP